MRRAALLLALLLAVPASAQTPRPTHVDAFSADAANANAVATITGDTRQLWLTGFEITSSGATAALCVVATLTGPTAGTFNFVFCAPAGVTAQSPPLIVRWNDPIPVNYNTNAVLTLPALGSGAAHADVILHGFRQ